MPLVKTLSAFAILFGDKGKDFFDQGRRALELGHERKHRVRLGKGLLKEVTEALEAIPEEPRGLRRHEGTGNVSGLARLEEHHRLVHLDLLDVSLVDGLFDDEGDPLKHAREKGLVREALAALPRVGEEGNTARGLQHHQPEDLEGQDVGQLVFLPEGIGSHDRPDSHGKEGASGQEGGQRAEREGHGQDAEADRPNHQHGRIALESPRRATVHLYHIKQVQQADEEAPHAPIIPEVTQHHQAFFACWEGHVPVGVQVDGATPHEPPERGQKPDLLGITVFPRERIDQEDHAEALGNKQPSRHHEDYLVEQQVREALDEPLCHIGEPCKGHKQGVPLFPLPVLLQSDPERDGHDPGGNKRDDDFNCPIEGSHSNSIPPLRSLSHSSQNGNHSNYLQFRFDP